MVTDEEIFQAEKQYVVSQASLSGLACETIPYERASRSRIEFKKR